MKTINNLKIGALLVTSLALVACNSKSIYDNHTAPVPSPVAPLSPLVPSIATILEGTWTYNKCSHDLNNKFLVHQNWYADKFETYTNHQIKQSITWSSDEICADPIITIKTTGSFTFGDIVNKATPDEYVKTNKTPNKLLVTINDQAYIIFLNKSIPTFLGSDFGFGITDWELNVPKDLTNNESAIAYFALNKPALDIFKINNKKLFEGDQGGDKDADGRPITLDVHTWGTLKDTSNRQTKPTNRLSKG
ncbi:MAG: hypothetical protein KAH18_02365 [Psychromonas sp.]|nr:hypothetical protein [Psychromonas sp.]